MSFETNEEEIVGQNDVNENEKKHKIETEEEDGGNSPSKRAKLENDFPDATKIDNDDDDEDSNPKKESIEKNNDSNDNKRKMENEDEEGGSCSPKKAKIENENDLGIKKDEKKIDEGVELMLEEDSNATNELTNNSSNVEKMADEICSSMITHWIPFY